MKTTLTRRKECNIALAMGQERNFNPARNLHGKTGHGKRGTRTQPEPRYGFWGRLY